MPQNGIIGVHGIQNDQQLQKMEHYFKMHHLILCRSEGVKKKFAIFRQCFDLLGDGRLTSVGDSGE